jgi:ABC-type Fe3+-hydroxamate transport system substrate-binding protein
VVRHGNGTGVHTAGPVRPARVEMHAYAAVVPESAAQRPRPDPARSAVLGGLIGNGGGRRAFVDATGTPVALPPAVGRLVATDDAVGALLIGLGVPLAGCAGSLDGVEVVGAPRTPDPRAVAALRPDVIVTGAVDRVHDLVDLRLVEALRRVAPVVAVDVGHQRVATADLRALLGPAIGGPPATEPVSERRVGAP